MGLTDLSKRSYFSPVESVRMESAAIRQEWEGRTLDGKFALLEQLAGSAEVGVFLTLRQGARKAAIKIIPAEGVVADAYLAHWEAAKALSHPYLMPLFDTGRSTLDGAGVVYVVTEFAEHDLARTIQEEALTPHSVRDIFRHILDVLSYVHAEGFIHGHVKPSKILLVEDKWKLSGDEFLAVEDRAWKPEQNPGIYDAPEVVTGKFTEATDTWCVGMTIAEALTQHPPTRNGNKIGEPHVPDSLPEPFFDIVSACLRSNPEKRCTFDEIRRELAAIPSRTFDVYSIPLATACAAPGIAPTSRVLDPIPAVPEQISPASEPSPSAVTTSPVASPPEPPADLEDDALARTGIPIVPIVLGLVVLIAFVLVLVLRSSRSQIPRIPLTDSTHKLPSSASPTVPQSDTPAALPNQAPGVESPVSPAPQQLKPSQTLPADEADETAPRSQSQTAQPSHGTTPQSDGASAPEKPTASTTGEADTGADQAYSTAPANALGKVREQVLPDVTQSARHSMRESVEVTVRVAVDRNGVVKDVSYISPDEGNYFARTAVRAAHLWKFTPPERNGNPQSSTWTLYFTFSPTKTNVEAKEDFRYVGHAGSRTVP